jgi:hypothetical protein
MDEDETRLEIRKLFYTIIADYRGGKRLEARDALSAMGDDEKTLADAAWRISEAIYGDGNDAGISEAAACFDMFPESGFWNQFSETSGQVLMDRAIRGGMPQDKKKMLFENGLRLVSKAGGAGFPLSKETLGLVSEGKAIFKESAQAADRILMSSDDKKSFRKTEKPAAGTKVAKRKRA